MLPDKKWDLRFLELARTVSSWSRDPSTKCGSIITRGKSVVSLGFNGFPQGVEDLRERYENRETKYKFVVHSELNAILAAKQDLTGCWLYVWPFLTCHDCAKAVIQAGIRQVVFPSASVGGEVQARWADAHSVAMEMYREANVTVRPLVMEGEH